jgi:tetratricopeptide (TPR) repeat protein
MRTPALLAAALLLAVSARAQTDEKKELATYQKAYSAAKKILAAKPKDPKVRSNFVAAGNRLATRTMTADSLPPRMKYPTALRLYREVLKVEPKNYEAKNNSEMIISIYKSMGRPIPK